MTGVQTCALPISLAEADLEAKLREVRRGLSDSSRIDPDRLRAAVAEDLLREKLLEWLEANSTVRDKVAATGDSGDGDQPSAASAKTSKAKQGSKEKDAETATQPID